MPSRSGRSSHIRTAAELVGAVRGLSERCRRRSSDGLVYGLMALGLSVIFGVVRDRQFRPWRDDVDRDVSRRRAIFRISSRSVDHDGADRRRDVRVRLRAAIGTDQSLHHPAGTQPVPAVGGAGDHHRQCAPDRVRPRCPHRADVLCIRQLPARAAAWSTRRRSMPAPQRSSFAALLFAFFRFTLHRQGDPRLRRQLYRRAGGRAQRQAALRAHVRHRRGLRRRRRRHDDADRRRHADDRADLHAAWLSSSSLPAGSARCRARCWAAC